VAKKPYIIALEEHYQDPEVKQLGGGPGAGRDIVERLDDLGALRIREMDEAGIGANCRLRPEAAIAAAMNRSMSRPDRLSDKVERLGRAIAGWSAGEVTDVRHATVIGYCDLAVEHDFSPAGTAGRGTGFGIAESDRARLDRAAALRVFSEPFARGTISYLRALTAPSSTRTLPGIERRIAVEIEEFIPDQLGLIART
jgi:hypothetical protein